MTFSLTGLLASLCSTQFDRYCGI